MDTELTIKNMLEALINKYVCESKTDYWFT